MLRIKNILHPTDFSPCAEHAFDYAVELARQWNAELHVVYVLAIYTPETRGGVEETPMATQLREKLEQEVQRDLDRLTTRHQADDVRVKAVRKHSIAVAPAILSYADEHDVGLIVLGTHGRRGMKHLLLGSVAEEIVRTAPCHVLTVRERTNRKEATEVRRILVPTDLSHDAREAFQLAKDLAAPYGAHIDVLHVAEPPSLPSSMTGFATISDLVPDVEEHIDARLDRLKEDVGGPDVPVALYTREGHPASSIVDFAKEHDSDLIVIATHGLSGVKRFLLGSVTEKVVRTAPCPVFIVKVSS